MPGLDVASQGITPNLNNMTDAEVGAWINSAPNNKERNIRKASAFVRLNMPGPGLLACAMDQIP